VSKRVVYKYSLQPDAVQKIQLPLGSNALRADFQGNDLVLWVSHPLDYTELAEWEVTIAPTGDPFEFHSLISKDHRRLVPSDSVMYYLNTVFIGALVFHIYLRYWPNRLTIKAK
jgi:hypothetical protein